MDDKLIENENVNANENQNEYQDYIDTINDLKAKTVSKEKYDKLLAEKKDLVNALRNNSQVTLVNPEKEVDVDELRAELFKENNNMTNLQYVEKSLKLRNAILEQEGIDIFLPNGSGYVYDKSDADKANYVAQVFQDCVDYAEGDDRLFTQELSRRIKDDSPMMRKNR